LQANCVQFRGVGTLPISGLVSEDTFGLEESYRVAFAIANEKKPHTIRQSLIKANSMNIIEKGTKTQNY